MDQKRRNFPTPKLSPRVAKALQSPEGDRTRGRYAPEMPGRLPARGGIPAPRDRDADWWGENAPPIPVDPIPGPEGPRGFSTHSVTWRNCPIGIAEGVRPQRMHVAPRGIPRTVTLGGWDSQRHWEVGDLHYTEYPSIPDHVGILTHTIRAWGNPPTRGREFRRVWNRLRRRMRREGKSRREIRRAFATAKRRLDRGDWHTPDLEGVVPAGHRWDCTTGGYRPIPGWNPPSVGPVTRVPTGRGWIWDHKRGTWVKPHTVRRRGNPTPVILVKTPRGLRVENDTPPEPRREITSPFIDAFYA